MATQARLPATLPTPALARANLRAAREEVKKCTSVAKGLKDRVAAAKGERDVASAEVEEAEGDLLAADEGSREDLAASERHEKALARFGQAERDHAKCKGALKLAATELKGATGRLRAAREDVAAIRAGRRAGK